MVLVFENGDWFKCDSYRLKSPKIDRRPLCVKIDVMKFLLACESFLAQEVWNEECVSSYECITGVVRSDIQSGLQIRPIFVSEVFKPDIQECKAGMNGLFDNFSMESLDKNIPICRTCLVSVGGPVRQALRCGKCGRVSYCSKECQRADWNRHKMLCKKN